MEPNKTKPHQQKPQDEYIDLAEIFAKIFIHWKWILVSVILCLSLGYIYLKFQSNVYQVTSSLLIKSNKEGGDLSAMSLLDELGLKSGGTDVENEVEILHSKTLMRRVVDSLDLYNTYYAGTIFNSKQELYRDSPYKVNLNQSDNDALKGSVTLILTPENNNGLSLEGEYQGGKFTETIPALPITIRIPAGTLHIEANPAGNKTLSSIKVVISNPKEVAKAYAAGLTAEVGKKNEMISLSLNTTNIEKGTDILNTLGGVYNQDAMMQINRSAINTTQFINDRLKYLTVELSDVEKDVENYKQQNKLTDLSAEAQLYMTKSADYDAKRADVETQLKLIEYVDQFVRSKTNANALIPDLAINDERLADVIGNYNTAILTRERVRKSTTEDNPALGRLNNEISDARHAIVTGIISVKKAMNISLSDLEKQNAAVLSRIRSVPRQEREFIEIKRQQQIKEQLYLFLLQKREEAALTQAVTVPKARVVDEADAGGLVSPKRNMILMLAFLMGLFIPIGIIYVVNLFDTKIKTRKELEKHSTVPVLAEIGHTDQDGNFRVKAGALDPTTELFRLLRSRLQFILDGSEEADKVIVVTSAEPSEGKTFVSINLASTLALADKKVLLLGLDLRNPALNAKLGLHKKEGISTYLSGLQSDYHKLIDVSPDCPNLHVLPAVIVPPNPNELLMKGRLDQLISQLKTEYDYIVIDTAPVGWVSDTFLLNRLGGVNLFIVRAGHSDKQDIELLNRIHAEETLSRLYIVLNDVEMSGRSYYYQRKYGYTQRSV